MNILKKLYQPALLIAVALTCTQSNADTVTLTAADINGGDTNTANYVDSFVTITPFIGDTAATFNGNAARLGIDGNGTNNNAFNDPDTDPNNNNDERLEVIFGIAAGMSQLTWDFARADGAGGGVFISGFLADPGASFAGQAAGYTSNFDSGSGTLSFEIPVSGFSNNDGVLNLSNLAASQGQTLLIRVADLDQGGAQLPIVSFSYGVVPEPTTLGLLAAFGFGVISRRKR